MFNTVFFDLDGTLVRLDLEFFFRRYVQALTPRFAGLMAPDLFARELIRWSNAMVENREPHRTNLEVLWGGFPAGVGVDRETLEPIFDRFYLEDFPRLRPDNARNPAAARLIGALVAKGYTPVIATNPLFPKVAILERLGWAGCRNFPYAYITCGEEMHFCKPNPEFFTEILARIGRTPEECLMVGNDMEEDMIAQRLGFKTALVTEVLIDRGRSGLSPEWRGPLAELAEIFLTDRETAVFT